MQVIIISPRIQIHPKTFSLCCVHSLLLQSILFLYCQVCLLQQLLRYYLCFVLKAPHCFYQPGSQGFPSSTTFFQGPLNPLVCMCGAEGRFHLPGNAWQYLETSVMITVGRGRVLLASHRWRPGMLLHFHRTATPTKHDPAPNVNSTRVRNPALIKFITSFVFTYFRPTFQASSVLKASLC